MNEALVNSLQNESLENRVFHAARELFYHKGYYATSTREIALKAGTSETGVFRKYPSKYDLLMAVYNDAWGVFNKALGSSSLDDPRREIIRIFTLLSKLYKTDPLTIAFMLINTGNTDTLLIERKDQAIISEENIKYIERVRNLCKNAVTRRLVARVYSVNSLTETILGIYEGTLLGWYLADHTKCYPERVTVGEMVRALGHILSLK
jgi:AcrR family transcriptional regulator